MATSQYDLQIDQTAANMRVCQHRCIIFSKKFTTHFWPTFTFSNNSNTRVGHKRCSRFIKITTKTKVNCCSTLDRFEQTLFLWLFYKKQVIVRYGIGSFSMQIASQIYNAANRVIAKNCQSHFTKFEVFFSRKPQGAIFQVATSLSIFSTTRPFLVQGRKQVNVIMYSPMLIET